VSDKNPFGYDSLKLRAIFIPEGNPDNITSANIVDHLGYDSLRVRAMLIPDGNPDNISAAAITSWLGYDVVRVRYAWSDSGESQQEQQADGANGDERASGPNQGADGPGFTTTEQEAVSVAPPTPMLARAPQYIDPAKAAPAAWRAITALSPPSRPAGSRDADVKGGTTARPKVVPADMQGESELDA
jgi:hypothetical protein